MRLVVPLLISMLAVPCAARAADDANMAVKKPKQTKQIRVHLQVQRVADARAAKVYVSSQNPQGRDMARKLFLQGAQLAAFSAGANMGIGIGVCTVITFGYMVQDGLEAKETWTPIDVVGNVIINGIGCSPIGFVMRMAQAKTDQERGAALLAGGLGFVKGPVAASAGQTLSMGQLFAFTTTTQSAKPAVIVKRQVRRTHVALTQ